MSTETVRRVAALLIAMITALTGCGEKEETAPAPQSPEIVESADVPGDVAPVDPELGELDLPPATEPEPTVATLVVCGDAMSHSSNIEDSWDPGIQDYNYLKEIGAVRPYVETADYAIANLETTLAADNYQGYPAFRTPDAFAYNLKDLGFDLMLTANNHCLDAGFAGVSRTLDVLDQVGIAHVGTSRTQAEADSDLVLADVGGISVAFVGYTYGTNGMPMRSDAPFSVNIYNKDYLTDQKDFDSARIKRDLTKAKALEPDLIAVLIHWGIEYQTKPNNTQCRIADFLIENGADLVLGGHPHIVQPVEEVRTVKCADGTERSGFVSYSLGNFISGQLTKNTAHIDATAILSITLEKDNLTGRTGVADWSYIPIYRTDLGYGYSGVRFRLLNPYDEPDNAKAQAELEFIHKIMGEENDYMVKSRKAQAELEEQNAW